MATLAWNGYRHMELYFGVTGRGSVLHTVNPRLFPAQIEYMLAHADDAYVFFDLSFRSWSRRSRPACRACAGSSRSPRRAEMPATTLPNLLCYEDLLAAEEPALRLAGARRERRLDAVLHVGHDRQPEGRALQPPLDCCCMPWSAWPPMGCALSARDTVLLVVPLFHVNAWGMPFAGAMCGAKLVLPGPQLDGASLFELMRDGRLHLLARRADGLAGVPRPYPAARGDAGLAELALRRVMVGGSAAPGLDDRRASTRCSACTVVHAWGMTETSPISHRRHAAAASGGAAGGGAPRDPGDAGPRRCSASSCGSSMRPATVLPRDGQSVGEIQVRGPWVVERYFRVEAPGAAPDGWFATGDVAQP